MDSFLLAAAQDRLEVAQIVLERFGSILYRFKEQSRYLKDLDGVEADK